MTLVELMVAMILTAIVLAAAAGFMVSAQKASVLSRAVNSNSREASNAMDEMGRMLRAATNNPLSSSAAGATGSAAATYQVGVQYASSTSVRFFAYVNLSYVAGTSLPEQPVEVQFTVDSAGRLVEQKWAGVADSTGNYWTFPISASASLPTAPSATRTMTTSAVNQVTFTYLDALGNTLSTASGAASDADLAKITSVRVTLLVGTGSGARAGNVSVTNTIAMPNLGGN